LSQQEAYLSENLTEAHSIKNFSTLLQALEDGELNSDLTHDLENVVRELQEAVDRGVSRKSTITVKIELKAERGVIELAGSYAIKDPPKTRRRTLMFIHAGKFLSRQDDRQHALQLRAVDDKPAQPIRHAE
jgi:hypothetical protein